MIIKKIMSIIILFMTLSLNICAMKIKLHAKKLKNKPTATITINEDTPIELVYQSGFLKDMLEELEADEEEVTWIKERMPGKITLDAYPNQQFNTTINKISFSPKNTTGSAIYTANCSLPKNENLRFRLGMAGEIEIVNW